MYILTKIKEVIKRFLKVTNNKSTGYLNDRSKQENINEKRDFFLQQIIVKSKKYETLECKNDGLGFQNIKKS